jgi:hypothetical protein
MRLRLSVIALASVLLVPISAAAAPMVIDFDSLTDSEVVTNQFAGLTFSSAVALTAGISLNEFEFPPRSGSNVVFDDSGPLSIVFATPALRVGGYFTYASALTLEAFDAGHASLGLVSAAFDSNLGLSGDAGSSTNEFLELSSILGIASITISGSPLGSSFVLDDLTIEPVRTAVPEPGSLGLLLSAGVTAIARARAARLAKISRARLRLPLCSSGRSDAV